MLSLQPGQNHPIDSSVVVIEIPGLPSTLGAEGFLLTSEEKTLREEDTVLSSAQTQNGVGFSIDLQALSNTVQKVAFCTSMEREGATFATLQEPISIQLSSGDGTPLSHFELATQAMPESALILGMLYRYGNGWKFRAIGQGFVGGKSALDSYFGHTRTPTRPAVQEMVALKPGQNIALDSSQWFAQISCEQASTEGPPLSGGVLLLDAKGRLTSPEGCVCYGRTASLDGTIHMDRENQLFHLQLDRLSPTTDQCLVVFSLPEDQRMRFRLEQLQKVVLTLFREDQTIAAVFAPEISTMNVPTLTLGRFYRHGEQWKFRALGEGLRGGIRDLLHPQDLPPPPAQNWDSEWEALTGQAQSLAKGAVITLPSSRLSWWFFCRSPQENPDLLSRFYGFRTTLTGKCQLVNGSEHLVSATTPGEFTQPPYVTWQEQADLNSPEGDSILQINGQAWSRLEQVIVTLHVTAPPHWQQPQERAVSLVIAVNTQPVVTLPVELINNRADAIISLQPGEEGVTIRRLV